MLTLSAGRKHMTNRYRALIAFALLPVAIAGCEDYEFTAPVSTFAVSPVFTSIDEGTTQQLTATDASGNPVSVTWASDNSNVVSVNSTGLAFGASPGVTAVIATNGAGEKQSASITVNQLQGIALVKGVPVTGLSGTVGTTKLYRIFVPPGTTQLVISLSGGTGDADLYVRRASPPTLTTFACRPFLGGNNETCTFNNPQSGTWYAWIDVFEDYAGASLVANYTP
jgi:hypothetical protein